MRAVASVLALAVSTSIATAQPAPADQGVHAQAVNEDPIAVGLAVNSPLLWQDANSVAVSGYIGFAKQHAIRLNVATWRYHASTLGTVAALAAGEDGDEGSYSGRTTDLGLAYQHYSESLFEGYILEIGLLRRALDTRVEDDYATPAIVETEGTGYAARAMIGWSWLWAQRVFLSVGVGISAGRYAGTERIARSLYMPEYMTQDFVRYDTNAEGYLRIGLAFGL